MTRTRTPTKHQHHRVDVDADANDEIIPSFIKQGMSFLGLAPTASQFSSSSSSRGNNNGGGGGGGGGGGVTFLSEDSSIVNLQHVDHSSKNQKVLRRRKLNWRVGPLQKKRNHPRTRSHPYRPNQPNIRFMNNHIKQKYEDTNSIAEKTVRSNHTFHSTDTIKVGNNKEYYRSNHPSLFKTNSVGSGSASASGSSCSNSPQQQQRISQRNSIPPPPSSSSPTAPSTPVLSSRRKIYSHSPSSITETTPSTVASTESPFHNSSVSFLYPISGDSSDHQYDDDDDDNGTVISPLKSSQLENSHRTIGLFLYDSENQKNKHDLYEQQQDQQYDNTYNKGYGNKRIQNYGGKIGFKAPPPVIHHKRRGLPPRSPHVGKLFSTSHHSFMMKNHTTTGSSSNSVSSHNSSNGSSNIYDITKDDDSESNQSGGPLWQLAKLQALAEGPISNSSSNLSIASSSIVSSTSTTDPQEIQRRQAERNLRAINSLAKQHLQHNEIPEAIAVLQEILRALRELHGEEHYRVGTVLHNLATVFMNIRQYKNALIYSRQSVEVRKRCLDSLHPDLAVSLTQLGVVHLELEEYEEAIQNFKRALVIRRKTSLVGDSSAGKIARLLNNIGCAYYESGKLDEAKMSFEEAIMVQKTLLVHGNSVGLTNQGVKQCNNYDVVLGIASTLCNLGSVKLRWRKYDEAIVALEEALLIQQSILGDIHPIVQSTKDSIDLVNSSRAKDNNGKRGFFKLAERLKELNSKDDIPIPIQCGVSGQKASSFSKLMTDIMNDVFEEFTGSQKLCNVDTTADTTGHGDDNIKSSFVVDGGSSQHDFYLI